MSVLEQIIHEVAADLYKRWSLAIPEDEKSDEAFKALAENAKEVTLFVIKNFMDRFNNAAEELKDK